LGLASRFAAGLATVRAARKGDFTAAAGVTLNGDPSTWTDSRGPGS
jgi:hypothetical protein